MRKKHTKPQNGLNPVGVITGIILGLIGGGLVALFRVPKSGQETRQQIRRFFQNDPIEVQIEQAKAAAHQRRMHWD
jgi:gas vesicle protein